MNITKKLSLSMAIATILGISPPVGAILDVSPSVVSATGEVVDLSTLLFGREQVITPHSGFEKLEDVGRKAHTTFEIKLPPGGVNKLNADIESTAATPLGKPPFLGYGYETPASLACVYKLAPLVTACNPNTVTTNPTGGSKAIALVGAYHYPNALTDLKKFSTQFGLPTPNLTVVKMAAAIPTDPYGWEMEEAVDIQWAHAMAPNAKIYLVEAVSNKLADMYAAVDRARALVTAAGGGEVSMSWAVSEFSTEASGDSHFPQSTNKVVYFASSGNSAGTNWPCVSSKVVCVGGTTLRSNPSTKAFFQETAWEDSGGGISAFIPRPAYQNTIVARVGTKRGVPDVSLVADPNTGGWVYYTASDGSGAAWWIIGGTSLSSAAFAGIVNSAAHFYASSTAELTTIYNTYNIPANYARDYRDITAGWCGPYAGWNAVKGWDSCTGIGSDLGKLGK